MKRLSSTRLRLAPSPPILISSSADISRLPGFGTGAPEFGRRPQHRLDDVLVAGAAAQVAGQRPAHVLLGRVEALVKERLGGQHHARRAEPALQPVLLPEALLQRVQLAGGGQALDGADLHSVGLYGQHRAGFDRAPVHQHGAGAAVGGVAAHVGPGQAEPAADQVGQQKPRLHLGDLLLAVDCELDPAYRNVCGLALGVVVDDGHDQAALSAVSSVPPRLSRRSTNVRTMCRLYSALPRWSVLGRAACAASSAACSMVSAVSGCPVRACAASVAPMVEPPTPVSAMPARITFPPLLSSATATPTVAKSPTRRSSLRYPPDLAPCAAGITASTAISSGSRTF